VTCTGGTVTRPPVDGIDDPRVVDAVELLRAPDRAAGAERVVVVGGGAVGCEVAFWLAAEHDARVTVIELLPHLMKENCTANRGYLLHYLERLGVEVRNCTRLESIADGGEVFVLRNLAPGVPDPYVTWTPILPENIKDPLARPLPVDEVRQSLAADLVVVATGLAPDTRLYDECVQRRVAPEVHLIGDAFSIGSVQHAVRAGDALGRRL